jgi:Poly(R)-hydroxyalkanoic acid synthase subunit (PHA_synth_III_E)
MSSAPGPWSAWLEGWRRLAEAAPPAQPASGFAPPPGPDPGSFAAGYGAFAEALARVGERAAQPGGEALEQTIARELDALRQRFPSPPFGAASLSLPSAAAALDSALRAAPLGPFGPSQALLQDLARALTHWQAAAEQQGQRLARAAGEALLAYGDRLRARLARGEPPWGVRESLDAWVECGEDAYARLCADDDYPALQARALNAAVAAVAAWRAVSDAQQRVLGLPSRAELDALEARLRVAEKPAAAVRVRAPRRKRRTKAKRR